MTDEEYLFRQTEKERKRIARGDKNKKRGGGRYVRRPSDYLTKKEREAMNGEVISFDPRKFYTAEEFNKLSEEFKVKWINSMLNRYNVGVGTIATVVLGKSQQYLYEQAKRHGYIEYLNTPKKGWTPKRADIDRLKKEVAEARKTEDEKRENFLNLLAKEQTEQSWTKTDKGITNGDVTVTADGDILPAEKPTIKADANNLAVLLSTLLGTGAKLTIELNL